MNRLAGYLVEIREVGSGKFLMLAQIIVAPMVDTLDLLETDLAELVLHIPRILSVKSPFFRHMLAPTSHFSAKTPSLPYKISSGFLSISS